MSSVDWEEVKRLAADFQRAQLGSTSLRQVHVKLENLRNSRRIE